MVRCRLLLGFLGAAVGQSAAKCTFQAGNQSQTCITCDNALPVCTPTTASMTISVGTSNTTTKVCADLTACTFELSKDNLNSAVTFTDSQKVITSLTFRRAFTNGLIQFQPKSNTFSNMPALTTLAFLGDRPTAGIDDPDKDFLQVDLYKDAVLPKTLTNLTLYRTYTQYLNLSTDAILTTLIVMESFMTTLPPTGLVKLTTLVLNSQTLWPFPQWVLDAPSLAKIDFSGNAFSSVDIVSSDSIAKFTSSVNLGSLILTNTTLGTCAAPTLNRLCSNYIAPTTKKPDDGPSKGAITTLVVVCCVASLLVLIALVVHRRNRHSSEMSPGILNSNSPDDDFYGIDEAYVTNQTMSKYKTAGANDASLTKIPPEEVALARCLGGDIWMGEMGNNRIVLRRAPRFAGDHITDSFFQGVKEMARLSHPNLVTYLGVTCLSGTDIYAVAEFMEKGSLISVYQTMPLTWEMQLAMATDVAEALHYVHTLLPSPVPVEHLRSANVLVSSTFSCKLNIFNFMASYKTSTMCKEMYGNNALAWRAPEVLMNEMKNFLAADIYSIGVILAEIGTCTRPFDREISEVGTVHTDVWIVDSVMAGKGVPSPYDSKSPKWTNLPEDYQKLVKACLHASPSQRPNSGIILQRLKALKKDGIEL
ncbi:unnamed protein product [Aphanomyces euteiches]|uniref:Protein kinase domain-containing protein n=1 Tax=Aphanomyces euteiches TaxID=100861 RepID=A0A6G0X993_9STRA|nr:hypothetical protein Ae201684_007513 [Aphanomyces euteiches]KAH9100646.1 hypothetical protein Ae201684P_006841 [Aphanomyces euteiches]KAH9132049.1 hypothetical protein AeRB84_021411 [Aphanomyces euteiches]